MKKLFLRLMISFFVLLGTTSLMAKTKVDIVFAMDTSGSMSDEATALVNAINGVTADLSSEFDMDAKLWGITGSRWGLTSYVTAEVSNPLSNHSEDWAPAVNDLSSKYNGWRSGTVKIVIPISDECPENGDGCYQDDETAVTNARAIADANGINVLPIIGSPYTSSLYSKIKQLASNLSTVSGKIITTSSSIYAEEMKEAIKDIVASVTGNIVRKPVFGSYSVVGNYINIPITKASGATGIEWEVTENGLFVDGQSTTSIDKISIGVPDVQTHEYLVKARSVGTDSSGVTIYSEYVEITVKKIGLFANLTIECTTNPTLPQCNTQKELLEEEAGTENPATPEVKVETKIGQVSDPVDITTGNFYLSKTDITIKTAGIPLIVTRQYNSLDIQRGWGVNIYNTMDTTDINNIKVHWGSGTTETFIKSETGWNSKYGTGVLYTESGFYTVETSDKTKFKFTFDGKLSQVVDKKGLGYKYEYSATRVIIKDSFDNLLLTINHDENQKIMFIEDVTGNSATYTYINSNSGSKLLTSYTDRNGNTTNYEYDANGILYKIIGADGNAYVENGYDAKGRVTSQLDGAGHTTSFVYDVDENTYIITKTTVTYPDDSVQEYNNNYNRVASTSVNGSNIAYEYDANGKISKLTNQDGKSWNFTRDGKGQLTEYKDPLGNSYKYTYDENSSLTQTENPTGQKVNFEYDSNQNLIKITYPDNSTKLFEYNANNQLLKTINQLGNAVTYEYDSRGFISKIVLPNTGKMKYLYNTLGQVVSVEDPLGNKVLYTYDKEGKVKTKTDALGNATLYAYNGYGDLVEITNANGGKTLLEYNTDGLKTKVTFPDSATIEYKYDVLGRLIETKDKLGRVSKTEYDSFGRVAKVTTPNGKFVEYKYDVVGNLIKIIDEKGNELKSEHNELGQTTKKYDTLDNLLTEKEYNALGLPTVIKDGTGRDVKFQYDSLNRLTKSTLSDSISASALYDALGQITTITDPKGHETVYEYDAMGNPTKETNPLGKSTTYSYDIYGRVTTLTNPNQTAITYEYDNVGNIKKLTFGGSDSITYSYDKLYNPTSIKDSLGEVTYSYDALSRVTKRKDVFGNELSYAYDEIGRLKSITYPDGKTVSYEYNNDDQLVKITDFNGNITAYEYDDLSNLSKVTYPNGFYTTYEYDTNHKLIKLQNFDASAKVVTANRLTRNTIGDITNIERTDAVAPDLANIVSTNFTVNEANQITTNGSDAFTYDNNGNLLSYKIGGEDRTFTYNLRDKVSSATIGSDNFTYEYDAEGNRVVVTKNGTTSRYVIDNVLGLQKPLAQTDTNNAIQKYFIYGNGLVYAVNPDGSIEIYLYDYKGSTTAIVDNSGTVLNAYTYSAYGKVLGSSESVENTYKYLGKYGVIADSDAHLYIRARYYSPELARWIQLDTLKGGLSNPLSLNRYSYSKGDSINYFDVSGYLRELVQNINDIALGKDKDTEKRDKIFKLLNFNPNGDGEYWNAFAKIPAKDLYTLKYGVDVKSKAFSKTAEVYPGIRAWNNEADGFRHTYLNFIMSDVTSVETAKKVGDAHERYSENKLGETIMDLTNNYIGRKLYERNKDNTMTPEEIVKEAIKLKIVLTSPPSI